MNVVQVVATISNEASGVTAVVLPLCYSLCRENAHIELITLDWAPLAVPHSFVREFSLGFGPRKLGVSPEMFRWLIERTRTGRVDLIHNHGLWMMPNVYSGRVASRNNIPFVVSPHGTLTKRAILNGSHIKRVFWPLVQKPALAFTTCFHATAYSEYKDIRRMGFRQPIAVISNGIDIPALTPKVQGASRTLLFLGRVHPIKGLDILLPAWQAVQARFPEWRLQIVGPDSGGYLSKMLDLATTLSLERVEFTGALLREQKQHAYRQADLFVLPTYSENFGMSVGEALAAGTPAIVTKGAPWDGLISHDAGWWIDIGVAPLVDCLNMALSQSSDTLSAMGLRGRIWMESEFSWERVSQKVLETYRWILNDRDKPEWVFED